MIAGGHAARLRPDSPVGRVGPIICLALLLAVAGCGKSAETRRADASQCSAYMQFVTRAYTGVMPGGAFAKAVNAASIGHKSADGAKISAAMLLGDQIARTLDPAVVTARAQDALSTWQRQVQANDVPAAVGYLDGCVENYDSIVAASR